PLGSNSARPRAAPVARRAARQLGVDLEAVAGTGPRGRITLDDVQRAAQVVGAELKSEDATEPVSPLRRAVARRLTASQVIPQFHLSRDVDASHLLEFAANVNDLLVQAIAETVIRHRALSAVY